MPASGRSLLLLVISTNRRYLQAVEEALAVAASEDRPLLVLYLLDSDLPRALSDRLAEDGFLADGLAEDLTDAVKTEQQQQGLDFLREVKRRAAERKVDCEIELQSGGMEAVVPLLVRKRRVGQVFLARRRRRAWERFFSASPMEELAAQLPCKVTILDY